LYNLFGLQEVVQLLIDLGGDPSERNGLSVILACWYGQVRCWAGGLL